MPVDWTPNPPREELLRLVADALVMNDAPREAAEAIVDTVLHSFVVARIKPYRHKVTAVATGEGYMVSLGHETHWFISQDNLGDLAFDGQKALDYVAETIAKQRAVVRAARAEQAKRRSTRPAPKD